MTTAENIILFDLAFTILLVTFGSAVGVVTLTPLSSLPAPPLAPQPGQIHCSQYDIVCEGGAGIAQATAYIGWAIVNIPVIIGYLIIETVLLANIVLGIAFSPQFGPNGVPYLGYFWLGLQVYVIWDVMRTFRGSSTGV